MNKPALEQELLGTTKHSQKNETFIAATMQAIKRQQAQGTFEQALRTTGTTKKESFIMKLKRLPKFALIGLATLGLAAVSGTTYAAYRLWTNPSASVSGNVINLQDCRQAGDSQVMYFDAKSGKDPEQTTQLLRAYCEISNIQQWAMHDLHAEPGDIMAPYTVTALDGNKVTVTGDKNDVRILSIGRFTTYVSSGERVAVDRLKVGDGVAYVAPNGKGQARAIVKLSQPLDYYRTAAQNLIITQDGCAGNPGELCRQGGGIAGVRVDTNGEAASLRFADDWELKTIEGKVVDYADDRIALKGSSGATYTIHTSRGLVAQFNADSTRNAGLRIAAGDTVTVQYRQAKGADRHMIALEELEQMSLAVTGDAKAGTLQKY